MLSRETLEDANFGHHARLRALFLMAPLLVVIATSIALRAADYTDRPPLNQGWVLERLRRQIEIETLERRVSVEMQGLEAVAPAAKGSTLRQVRRVVRRGDTFVAILSRLGLDPADENRWQIVAREHRELSRLRPGRVFTFLIDREEGHLSGLQYEMDRDAAFVMRASDDDVSAEIVEVPTVSDTKVVGGQIESNLYAAVIAAGAPDEVISRVVDIFGWEVDFTRDVRSGDTFRIAWEEKRTAESNVATERRILAAELVLNGERRTAVAFQNGDAVSYYTEDGRPVDRGFLRFPVEFTRISSPFSTARFHPILKVRRPHMGVDFAAPSGTPVRSIASGTVTYAGSNGGHGRFVKIRHGSGIESSYSHLSSIAVRSGARVERGQVLGGVGATGLATGPHLHFAMYRDGRYVNPMDFKLPPPPSLPKGVMPEFAAVRDELLARLDDVPASAAGPMLARADLPVIP